MKNKTEKRITLGRWIVRTLAISASTFAVIEILKGEVQIALSITLAWILIVITERRMFDNHVS